MDRPDSDIAKVSYVTWTVVKLLVIWRGVCWSHSFVPLFFPPHSPPTGPVKGTSRRGRRGAGVRHQDLPAVDVSGGGEAFTRRQRRGRHDSGGGKVPRAVPGLVWARDPYIPVSPPLETSFGIEEPQRRRGSRNGPRKGGLGSVVVLGHAFCPSRAMRGKRLGRLWSPRWSSKADTSSRRAFGLLSRGFALELGFLGPP